MNEKREYPRMTIECTDGIAQQNFKDMCDINTIVERARVAGDVTHLNDHQPVYVDASQVPDYYTALNAVIQADDAFMKLDASVRERFQNDPGQLLEFISQSENFDEGVKLGIFEAKPVSVVVPVSEEKPQVVIPKGDK